MTRTYFPLAPSLWAATAVEAPPSEPLVCSISASQRQASVVQASRVAMKLSSRGGLLWSVSVPVAFSSA